MWGQKEGGVGSNEPHLGFISRAWTGQHPRVPPRGHPISAKAVLDCGDKWG